MNSRRYTPLRYVLQAFNYSVFMGLIWFFSTAPSIQILARDQAVITIAFAHGGELREPCRKRSEAELAKLAPNMRKPEECTRERSPVTIEALLDGNLFYRQTLQPSGLFDDGGVDIYFQSIVSAGSHQLNLKMDDSVRKPGFNHHFERQIEIDPAQILLVQFDNLHGFRIHREMAN